MTPKEAEEITSAFFDKLENGITSKYHEYLGNVKNIVCKVQNRTIYSINKKVCHADYGALSDAFIEIKNDIIFLIKRRGNLIDSLKPSLGKIAGVIAYRLAKSQIIHLQEGCAFCSELCTAKKLNQLFALRCACDYMGIQCHYVPEHIRKELFYSFSYRHVNQETLGLVFDALKELP